jgi:hypothetical protein
MTPISNITAFFLMLVLTTTTTFAQNNPYGDTQHSDKSKGNDNRNHAHRHCTNAYSNKLFNRDYAGLANSNMYHLNNELRSYIKYRCVTSEQIRRLSVLFQTDREKYDFLTYGLNYVYDIENYAMTGSILANRNARDGFYRFLVQQGVPAGDYYNNNTYYAGGGYYPPVYTQVQPAPTNDNTYNNYPDPRVNNPSQAPQYNNLNQPQQQYNNPNGNQNGQNNDQNGNQNGQYNNQNGGPNAQYNNQNGNQNNNQNQTPQYNNGQPPVQVNSKAVNSGYQGLMTYKEFAMMKDQIKQNTLEKGRLETAKQMTQENILTAIQVAEIARLFNFDNNRLDFAKFAFEYTYDRDAYHVVGDVFVFQKNKEDLQRYIQTKK